ncbi:polysaccharide deacetylase family protein [Paenibacillus sp. OT2-17]|nr:polysaccharide deacetylase family protein [Paenibacillus sp. OT2-17]
MKQTFIILISALLVYTIIPTLIIRLFGIGVYKRGTGEQPIALTFDDGPDPEFTPLLLDLLKKYNIKGTFFVLGRKAEKYPDLIQRMHNEGHLVGIHNYVHWSNALMSPKRVREQVNKTANVINRIIGE